MHMKRELAAAAIVLSGVTATAASAADWSNTYIGARYGTKFAEPFNNQDISKTILNLNHVSGYTYGTNFFNVDFLMSDSKDPGGRGASAGAQEAYAVYRHTLEWGKLTKTPLSFGPVKDVGLTFGFDWNTKTDAGYNSKKRMWVLGPTLMLGLSAGFLNVSILGLWESNAPYSTFTGVATPRYSYDFHPMLAAAWAIPLGKDTGLTFEGFLNWIAPKGANEFGVGTATETNIDAQVMYDVGSPLGWGKNKFKIGLEYQYWRNKFGNQHKGAAGDGAFAKTPMIRVQYHF
ncbi:MAG TPA: outer envelope protein [Burkholderiaceae bacterium]|nr:outer envelope protein [Burkholderiaceae bacterium]